MRDAEMCHVCGLLQTDEGIRSGEIKKRKKKRKNSRNKKEKGRAL
jgi:hypothetical protein